MVDSVASYILELCIVPVIVAVLVATVALLLEYYVIQKHPNAKDLPIVGPILQFLEAVSTVVRGTWLLIRLNCLRLVFLVIILVTGLASFNLAFGSWLRGSLVFWGVLSLLIAARLLISLRTRAEDSRTETLTTTEIQGLRQLLAAERVEHSALAYGVLSGSYSAPLGTGPSRIYHVPWPYILPICFRNPKDSKYTYVVVGDNCGAEPEDLISFEPTAAELNITTLGQHGTCWYQLTSSSPLESITFGNVQSVRDFTTIPAEFRRLGTWNVSSVVVVPDDRSRAYALGITEQIEPSTWYFEVDGQEFTFDQIEGCHFVEFVLQPGTEHTLSLGYKEGAWGIACAFVAF
jgi:hypothetical protein